ncbi:hypothetical protein FJZ53_00990 [Candidatus Woesearchaeota archaeon]|nr:hypothetical protein [Candidatus Woesearchaeota archaeon]
MKSHKKDCKCCAGKKGEDKPVPALAKLKKEDWKALNKYVDKYKDFLDNARTPRQVVDYVEETAKNHGFSKDQIFINDNRTNIALVDYSDALLDSGLRILGAHVDSPCLHVKVNPLKTCPLGVRIDTQYYGRIVKYQWFDQLVRVLGHVVKDGKEIPVDLEGVIVDIAPHINAGIIAGKTVKDAFSAEDLDILTGYPNKKSLLKRLGIEEKDFMRAELYAVPVEKTRVLKDLIVGYGHDDRVCVFTQLMALLESKVDRTSIVFGVDKEEIGSTGFTGAQAVFFERVLDQVVAQKKHTLVEKVTDSYERQILAQSIMLSADVDFAMSYRSQNLFDPQSNTKAGHGLVISTYNGHGGKYGGNQVTAKLMDQLMNLFEKKGALYQVSGSPSKVDGGGGGTIAKYFAQRGVQTVDAGVPVEGMHSKTEVIHKGDLYQAIKCFKAFLEE